MQRRLTVRAAVLAAAALLAACSGQSPVAPNALDLESGADGSSQTAQAADRSTAPMRTFPAGVELPGTSSLVRTDQGISMTVHATGLTPGQANTVWFVAFNDPGGCSDDICDVQDVLANRGVPAVRFGAGHVIGDSGQANFGGHLAVGNTGGPPCAAGPSLGSCGPGLLDARTAVVHLVPHARCGDSGAGERPNQLLQRRMPAERLRERAVRGPSSVSTHHEVAAAVRVNAAAYSSARVP